VPSVRGPSSPDDFALVQDFIGESWPAPCHYYYRQRFEFYGDGRLRVMAGNLGRGCGDEGTYRPVLRLDFAGDRRSVSAWRDGAWAAWTEETYAEPAGPSELSPEGFQLRVADAEGAGWYVEPGQGQFADGGRGDNAWTYATLNKPGVDEGSANLITIGPCGNADYRQGPERFIEPEPEPIEAADVTLWYVAQLENDAAAGREYCWADVELHDGVYVPKAFPCYAGPLLVPISP
jgi:hypothetical protein